MDTNYIDYLNITQQEEVKEFSLVTKENIYNIKKGDLIKLIKRSNLQFKKGGIVMKLYDDCILAANLNYKYKFIVTLDNYIILYKKNIRKSHQRKFMEYILDSLENNSLKITKKDK